MKAARPVSDGVAASCLLPSDADAGAGVFSARFAPDLLSGLAGPGLTGLPACVPLSRFAAGLEDPDAQYNCEL